MNYYLIAGEASGDLHGANLMKAIKAEDPSARFRYFGGDLMREQGGELVKHISEMAFMGFVEVLLHLRTISRNLKLARKDVVAFQPDALILIDFPGFNLRIAEFARSKGIPVFYYISPKVWAWNQKRVLKIKRVVDHLFCILPFEVAFYKKWGMEVDYVGNPLLDAISSSVPDQQFREHHQLGEKPILALLPGSRRQEISRLLLDMLAVAARFPDHQAVIAGAPNFDRDYYAPFIGDHPVALVHNATYDLLRHARAALVTSGTATLETALFNVPQVVLYKGNALTIGIARALITIRFISLVNLVVDRAIVAELIQADCRPDRIAAALGPLLADSPARNQLLGDYRELAAIMGQPGASQRTAELIQKCLSK